MLKNSCHGIFQLAAARITAVSAGERAASIGAAATNGETASICQNAHRAARRHGRRPQGRPFTRRRRAF
jgi:hypothetical protein